MKQRILIIDDEPDIRAYLAAALEDNGFDALALEDGRPVMEAVSSFRPHCIILDMMMPVRSGLSVYRDLRTHPDFARIPVIIISGMQSVKEFMRGAIARHEEQSLPDPDGVLEKPLSLEQMMETVKRLTSGTPQAKGPQST